MNEIVSAKPFIKWVGGKRNLLSDILPLTPDNIKNYFEPFMGGAALFYNIQDKVSGDFYLSDFNDELVNCYLQVRDNIENLTKELKLYKNTKEFFEEIRSMDRMSDFKSSCRVKRAARFIYLNRTAFNGMWRVNKKNQFNVPYGKYPNDFAPDISTLMNASNALKEVSIKEHDYAKILDSVQEGDFVYLDPPYVPISETSAFTSYTHKGFDNSLQSNLYEFCKKLDERNVNFMQSNSSADSVYKMYEEFNIFDVMANRNINSKGDGRAKVKEVLITNYKK